MNEQEFWSRLTYRVSSELAQFEDDRLRFLWCDGFKPEGVEIRDGVTVVIGYTWFGDTGQEQTPFTLLIGGPEASRDEVDWTALLPSEEETGWLGVREWGLEIIPPAIDPTRLSHR
jgi:hypothetical protein